jgi:hypothetical protein
MMFGPEMIDNSKVVDGFDRQRTLPYPMDPMEETHPGKTSQAPPQSRE